MNMTYLSATDLYLSKCDKNIVTNPNVYNNFEKTCTSTFNTTILHSSKNEKNPLIYCPKIDGSVIEPGMDSKGNIYCYNAGKPYCLPKVNPFSTSDSPIVTDTCEDYCEPISSFFVDGRPTISATSAADCESQCINNDKCTGYTFYNDSKGGQCMLYSLPHEDYSKYQTLTDPPDISTITKQITTETKINGFPCSTSFTEYKRSGNSSSVDKCVSNITGSDSTDTMDILINAVKDLSCQYAACTTELKEDDGKFDFFKHSNTLFGEVTYYLYNGSHKVMLRVLYALTGIVVYWMLIRFVLYKIVGGFGSKNKYNIFEAFFGNNNTPSILAFLIPSALTAFTTFISVSSGDFMPALYTTIVCTTILIIFLGIINVSLTMKAYDGWRLPGGFQLIFMIILILGSLVGSIYFFYESIKDRDYGSSAIESEAPFIIIPKIHNYGYIVLMVTIGISLIAILFIVKKLFSSMKYAQQSGSPMGIKENTKSIGIIASALYGIVGGLNMVLTVVAPFLLLTLVIFERIFGSIMTKASNKEGFIQNMMINIGIAINGASSGPKFRRSRRRRSSTIEPVSGDKKYLRIGQEFFGGGPSNGWAPFGTTLLNIILGMMTNYNYVLSRSDISETRVGGKAQDPEKPSSIRVLDKEMWFVGSNKNAWLLERNNPIPNPR